MKVITQLGKERAQLRKVGIAESASCNETCLCQEGKILEINKS